MHKKQFNALWACLFAVLFLIVTPAKAEISFAVVDVQRIMSESKAAVSIQTKVQEQREKLQAEFAGYEQGLRNNEKELIENRTDMNTEEFKQKREEFQKNLQETGALVQEKKRNLERALATATAQLRGAILQIVAQMAEDRNYDVVMTRQNIVLVAKTLDITDEVMEAINAQLQDIPLEMEK